MPFKLCLIIVILLLPFDLRAVDCLDLLENHIARGLGSGSAITYMNARGKKESAIFLGYQETATESLVYIFHKKSRRIVEVPVADFAAAIIDFRQSKNDARPLKTKKITDPSCAVSTSMGCLQILSAEGMSPDSSILIHDFVHKRKPLYEFLWHMVSDAARSKRIEERGGGFMAKISEPSQAAARRKVFKENGIRARPAKTSQQILRHVLRGGLAIFDGPIKVETIKVYDAHKKKVVKKFRGTFPQAGGEFAGGHSALVLGAFKTGLFQKRLIVLDPYSGEFAIWKLANIKPQYVTLVN